MYVHVCARAFARSLRGESFHCSNGKAWLSLSLSLSHSGFKCMEIQPWPALDTLFACFHVLVHMWGERRRELRLECCDSVLPLEGARITFSVFRKAYSLFLGFSSRIIINIYMCLHVFTVLVSFVLFCAGICLFSTVSLVFHFMSLWVLNLFRTWVQDKIHFNCRKEDLV